MKTLPAVCHNLINENFDNFNFYNSQVCSTCYGHLKKNKIPVFSTSNGFKYPIRPVFLPDLDILTERLISPRLPFMAIRRLRHGQGQYGILGQIINVPVSVNNMVTALPRNLNDDFSINVHIKRKQIHKSSYMMGVVKKNVIKIWLQYLINTPLFKFYKITIDNSFFNTDNTLPTTTNTDEVSEVITIEDSLHAQQQTLMWNEDQYLCLAPAQNNAPISILFDEHCEELSFPSIYLGEFRTFKEGIAVTPFMIASSELRRADRRGVTPPHLLYMAMKKMRIRIRDSITIAFKYIGLDTNITRADVENPNFLHGCIDKNLEFLRSIPNSVYYWTQRKRDLFAMIRQLGKPTFFLTMSANEIGWPNLMSLLYKLKHKECDIDMNTLENMHFNDKASLVNEDPVTCAIYFNKLINKIMDILKSPRFSPFGNHYVKHFFKRIEFQHRGSPHAHILLWLNEAPNNALGENSSDAVNLINKLVSVNAANASAFIKLQTHKHTFTCNNTNNHRSTAQKCRFGAPFMPCKQTIILTPMPTTDCRRVGYRIIYERMWKSLEETDFENIDKFFEAHQISSYDTYLLILQAGITRPMVFLQRETYEKWINPFNPFIFNILRANMDLQFITEEYSCAAYVVEYVNKTNRGISNLQQNILKTMDEHPEFDVIEVTRQLGITLLNCVELTSQEAAWYLLRQPMSESSIVTIYIPTSWPRERERIRKTNAELERAEIDGNSCDIWKENIFDKYHKRPIELENVTLAQFAAHFTLHKKQWKKRLHPRIIRYRNYDIQAENNNYKREMVTLHLPFRDEENDILAEHKYIQLYDTNDVLIMQRRQEFESSLDICKTLEICRKLCIENDADIQVMDDLNIFAARAQTDVFDVFLRDPNADINADIRSATLSRLGAIVRKRDNIMPKESFNSLMRQTNMQQRALLLHVIDHIIDSNLDKEPIQIFLTGPAGCGKTFVIHLLKEIYNRFTNIEMPFNSFLTCASTGKAAVAIDGTTIHTAFKISIARQSALFFEALQQFRSFFKFIRSIIIDEISMVSAELNEKIDSRLKQITGTDITYGGRDMYLIGDLRQLPPVRATPIFKQTRNSLAGSTLWRSLRYYELTEVMRQSNTEFANLLTRVGNGEQLNESQLNLIESRFFTKELSDELCTSGIRLFFKNEDVVQYNQFILGNSSNKIISIANDSFCGYHNAEQLAFCRQKLHKMPILDTGGLPYELTLVINKPYIITTNIDVSDGLANGAIGILSFIEYTNDTADNIAIPNDTQTVKRLWLNFPETHKIGAKIKRRSAHHATTLNIDPGLIPISRRNCNIFLNNNKTISVKRNHFPLMPACGMTIHKSQGATFEQMVYHYDKKHDQQLVYVALSRVTSIDGLFIVAPPNDHVFHHGRRPTKNLDSLRQEFSRLSTQKLETIQDVALQFLQSPNFTSLMTFNCQSLAAHKADLQDPVTKECDVLLLTETWIEDDTTISLPWFLCASQYKRSRQRSGGVAIYGKVENNLNVRSNTHISHRLSTSMLFGNEIIGDVCSTEYILKSGLLVHLIAVYISPNQTIKNIIKFLHYVLLPYTEAGARELGNNLHLIPIIMGGDFNTNFSKEESKPLLKFLFDIPQQPTIQPQLTLFSQDF